MMFAQANSEHCRHKIFNASWTIAGQDMLRDDAPQTPFKLIKHTHAQTPQYTLSAYSDNAAVVGGYPATLFRPDPQTHAYRSASTPGSAYHIQFGGASSGERECQTGYIHV